MKTLVKFLNDEKGMETVEWAVLASILVVATVTAIGIISEHVQAAFEKLRDATVQN